MYKYQHSPPSSKAKLTWFNGWLSGLATKALPSCLQYLELAVKNDAHYRELLPYLSSLARRLPRLEWLGQFGLVAFCFVIWV